MNSSCSASARKYEHAAVTHSVELLLVLAAAKPACPAMGLYCRSQLPYGLNSPEPSSPASESAQRGDGLVGGE